MIFVITLELNHSLSLCSLRTDEECKIMVFQGLTPSVYMSENISRPQNLPSLCLVTC